MKVICHKTYNRYLDVGTKAIFKGYKLGLFVNFGQLSGSWIRKRDLGEQNHCGSMRIRI
jgi:hypothetical protein